MNKVKVEVENTLVSDMHLLKNSYNNILKNNLKTYKPICWDV